MRRHCFLKMDQQLRGRRAPGRVDRPRGNPRSFAQRPPVGSQSGARRSSMPPFFGRQSQTTAADRLAPGWRICSVNYITALAAQALEGGVGALAASPGTTRRRVRNVTGTVNRTLQALRRTGAMEFRNGELTVRDWKRWPIPATSILPISTSAFLRTFSSSAVQSLPYQARCLAAPASTATPTSSPAWSIRR